MNSVNLTDLHLNILVTAYYTEGSVCTDGLRDTYDFLVKAGLIYYTSMMRHMVAIHSLHRPTLVEKVPGPTIHAAIAVTEEGQELVADVSIARKVEACIAMGDIEATKALANSLSMEELPPLLASDCGFVRDAAKDKLIALGNDVQVEEDSSGKIYFIDLQGGGVACIKGLAN